MTDMYEPTTSRLFAERCQGKIVADVGAYLGHYTRLAVDHGAKHVVAFEPRMSNFIKIDWGFEDIFNVQVKGMAVSDTTGYFPLHYDPIRQMTASLKRLPWHTQFESVRSIRLDDRPEDFGVIKIDVEGTEPAVIRGSRIKIGKNKPTIFVEVLYDCIGQEIQRELPIPYRYYKINDTLDVVQQVDSLTVGNDWCNFMLEPV